MKWLAIASPLLAVGLLVSNGSPGAAPGNLRLVVLVGTAVRDDPALQVATAAALDAGVAVVAAAGDGDDQALSFPAGYDGVISVASTGQQMSRVGSMQSAG